MSTVTQTPANFGVQLGDHTFPSVRQARKVKVAESPEVIEEKSLNRLHSQLADSISGMLPFFSQPQGTQEKRMLFASYVDSVSVLQRCRQEVLQLFRAMIETAIEFDSAGSLSAESRAQIAEEFLQDADVPLSLPENLATADMAAFDPDEIQTRLQASLQKSVQKLVGDLFEGLDVLTERSVAGLVQWTSPNTVKYHFFRRLLQDKGTKTKTKRGRVRRRTQEESIGDFRKWKRVNRRTTTTTVNCRLAHHRHETIDAIHTSIDNSQVVMPQFVQALVRQIPDWMCPSINVIDGYLIRESIQHRDLCQRELTQVETVEELLHGHEPAVCLGPYVLTGWGPREIETEVQRRTQTASTETGAQSARFWGVSAVACQVFCVLFAHVGLLPLAAVLFLMGMASISLWIGHSSKLANRNLSQWSRQRISLGFLALLGGLQLVLTPVSLAFVFVGVPLMAIGGMILSYDRQLLLTSLTAKGA